MELRLLGQHLIYLLKYIPSRLFPLFAVLLFARIANAFLLFTVFAPDEYFQSVEVAHQIVFGYDFNYLLNIDDYLLRTMIDDSFFFELTIVEIY